MQKQKHLVIWISLEISDRHNVSLLDHSLRVILDNKDVTLIAAGVNLLQIFEFDDFVLISVKTDVTSIKDIRKYWASGVQYFCHFLNVSLAASRE